jgi:hypothetical protein
VEPEKVKCAEKSEMEGAAHNQHCVRKLEPVKMPEVPIEGLPSNEEMQTMRRKELFGNCALIEIVHLHDCLRGALKALETDVNNLVLVIQEGSRDEPVRDLERRVAGRFKVIWSVFRAHSSAEDEFIWPALRLKTQGRIKHGSPKYNDGKSDDQVIGQEEYEEDHADEEKMFGEMDKLLSRLRDILIVNDTLSAEEVDKILGSISERTKGLSKHLMTHLEKEETQCMPLVVEHLSKTEINELVGNIMGKRSADTIAEIMTMAVQNLEDADREEVGPLSLASFSLGALYTNTSLVRHIFS